MKKSEILEGVRDFRRRDITPIGGTVVTHLDGIRWKNRTFTDVIKSLELFAVSNTHRTQRYFRAPHAPSYPRVS